MLGNQREGSSFSSHDNAVEFNSNNHWFPANLVGRNLLRKVIKINFDFFFFFFFFFFFNSISK